MKKKDCIAALPVFFRRWREKEGLLNVPENDLSSFQFYMWMENNHPQYVNFRSQAGPMFEVERWFDYHTNQMWKH